MDYQYSSEVSHTKAKAGDTEKWVASLRPLLDINKSTSMSHRELIMMDTAVLDIEMKKASVTRSELEVSVFPFPSFQRFHPHCDPFLFSISSFDTCSRFVICFGAGWRDYRTLYPRILWPSHASSSKPSSLILFWASHDAPISITLAFTGN